jgi:hypothetical protein
MLYCIVTPTPQQAASAVNAISCVWRMAPVLASIVERLTLIYADNAPAVAVTPEHIVINPVDFATMSPERQVIELACEIAKSDHSW